MIKICFIIGQLEKGGTEKQLYELVKNINRRQFVPVVISLSAGGFWGKEFKRLNVQLYQLPRRKSVEFRRLIELFRLVHRLRPHIVHTFLSSANCYGRIAALLNGVPIILSSERSLPKSDKRILRKHLDRILAHWSDGVICNSRRAAQLLAMHHLYPLTKIFTVRNGIYADGRTGDRFDLGKERSKKTPVVGTVGRLSSEKNQRLFLQMAQIVLTGAQGQAIKFVIVGDGGLRGDLEACAGDLGLGGHLHFTGERDDVSWLLRSIDIFVLTSLYEGLSNALMEAMGAGCAVVATNVGGNGELIRHGETGLLCDLDARTLADCVTSLLNNPEERRRLGENAKKSINAEFSLARMLRSTQGIYLRLCEHKLPGAGAGVGLDR